MSNVAYRPLTIAEAIYKAAVWDTSIDAGMYVLEVYPYTSFLGLPGIKQVFEGTVRTIGDWIYKNLVLFTDMTAIKLVNSVHQSAYDKASLELKIIAQEKGTASDEYKKALAATAVDLSKFTRFGSQ